MTDNALLHFCAKSPNDNAETMLTDIMLGVTKDASATVYDDATSALWDRLTQQTNEITASGGAVVYDNERDE
jgi:hypothetical protein